MAEQESTIRGTREWAVANIDCCTGCPHDCRYCYARYDAVAKRGEMTEEAWRRCRVDETEASKAQPLFPGQVMFPTTHDIVPENLEVCLTVIANLLAAGNRVLVVSKPHLVCIEKLCQLFAAHHRNILLRFTITARDDKLLAYWEPGAPHYRERLASLRLAHGAGFATSVSVEPMLDTSDVVEMVAELGTWVNHSIWLGKMNRIEQRVRVVTTEDRRQVERIRAGQTDEVILRLYRLLQDNPLIRWKESIKEVVGLPLADRPGLDR